MDLQLLPTFFADEMMPVATHTYEFEAVLVNKIGSMQAEEERQRPPSKGSGETALAQLRAMQRRSDLYSLELVVGPDDRSASIIERAVKHNHLAMPPFDSVEEVHVECHNLSLLS